MFIFQFLNDRIHSYVLFDMIVNLIIPKLKKKTHFPQKVYKLSKAKFSHFDNERRQKPDILDLPKGQLISECLLGV